MRTLLLLWALALPATLPAQDKTKDTLEGEWTVVSLHSLGKPLGDDQLKQYKLVVKGDEWVQTTDGAERRMTFKVDPTKSPKEIDFTAVNPGGRARWQAIYNLEGDTLTVCRANQVNPTRPKEFKASLAVELTVYKRAEKK
jgi:uncharacterized protein (TIGR03067 family)